MLAHEPVSSDGEHDWHRLTCFCRLCGMPQEVFEDFPNVTCEAWHLPATRDGIERERASESVLAAERSRADEAEATLKRLRLLLGAA